MLYTTIDSVYEFQKLFISMNRSNQFSFEALSLIYDYLDDVSSDELGYKVDVIAICCEFHEYTLEDLKSQFDFDGESETTEEFLERISDKGLLLSDGDTFVVSY